MTSRAKIKSETTDDKSRTISVSGDHQKETYTCSIDPWPSSYPMEDTGAFLAKIVYPSMFTTSESRYQCALLTPKLPKISSPTGWSKIRQVTIKTTLDLNSEISNQFLGKEAGVSSTRQPRGATESGETHVYFDALIVRDLESSGKSLSRGTHDDVQSYIDEALDYQRTSKSGKVVASTVKNPDTSDGAWPVWTNAHQNPNTFGKMTWTKEFYDNHAFMDLLFPGDRIAVIFREGVSL